MTAPFISSFFFFYHENIAFSQQHKNRFRHVQYEIMCICPSENTPKLFGTSIYKYK